MLYGNDEVREFLPHSLERKIMDHKVKNIYKYMLSTKSEDDPSYTVIFTSLSYPKSYSIKQFVQKLLGKLKDEARS